MLIEFKQRDFFMSVLEAFLEKRQIDITVSRSNLLLEVIEVNRIYLNLDNSIFSADFESKFSLDPGHLHRSLNLLSTNQMTVEQDYVCLKNDRSYIKIPLLSTLEHQYEEIDEVHTRFMIHPKNIEPIAFLKGLVRYEIENDTLFIRKMAQEVFNEIEIKDVDFIEMGELSFSCNNNWSTITEVINKNVEGVMFLFSDCFLSVQILFKGHENVYFEIQIPKSLVD